MWGLICRFEKDLLRFVETMQKQKRQANALSRSKVGATANELDVIEVTSQKPYQGGVMVDVSKNFNFVTNFGTSKISLLMQEYIFEGILPALTSFISLRIPLS